MKLKRTYLEIAAFLAVYFFAIYLWTLPFQDNKTPYGEFDAISHWELADYVAQNDKTFVYLPPFIDYSYPENNKYKPRTLWYHPPFHTDLAMVSAFANDRMVPIYLTNAIFASSILISVFFVIRKLYGFLPAILSSFLLTFSMRDIMPYLWGQWPERFAYAFIPLILYCFYMYYITYSKESSKPIYIYMMSFLLAVNIMIHPLVFFHSLAGLFVLWVLLLIRHKKLAFNFKHIVMSLIIFIVLFAIFPYQTASMLKTFSQEDAKSKQPPFSRLFQWSFDPQNFGGSVPPSYFSFKEMNGMWTLPFLLIGILALAIRRQNRDIFLLAWLISLYLVLHRDFIGKTNLIHRSLSATAHVFVPITILGALFIVSFIKAKQISQFLKYGMALLVVILTFSYSMPQAYSTLNSAYDYPLKRLNKAQVDVSEWLKANTNDQQNVSIIGPPPELMEKVWWMASVSQRVSNFFEGFLTWGRYKNKPEIARSHLLNDLIVMDYSDIGLISDRSYVDKWQQFERQNLVNHTLLYNKGNIGVYKYEAKN